MLNLYEEIRINQSYIKLEAGEFLFAEYTCPIEEKSQGIWTHTDYIVHVVSGKKIWHTPNESWTAEPGQTIYFKRGQLLLSSFSTLIFAYFSFSSRMILS